MGKFCDVRPRFDREISSYVRYNEGLSAAQWEEIGAHLGLPTIVLKEVEYTWPRSPDRCLLEVVSRWSKSNSTVSKEEFLQALK